MDEKSGAAALELGEVLPPVLPERLGDTNGTAKELVLKGARLKLDEVATMEPVFDNAAGCRLDCEVD
jgi:hypothetical protein